MSDELYKDSSSNVKSSLSMDCCNYLVLKLEMCLVKVNDEGCWTVLVLFQQIYRFTRKYKTLMVYLKNLDPCNI